MHPFKNIILQSVRNKPIALDIFYKEKKPQPVVIYAHGFNGFKDWGNFDLIAEQFAQAGFVFIKFNFSHNGTTPDQPEDFVDLEAYGNNNYTKELEDLQTVIDWTLNDNNEHGAAIDKAKLYLTGHSKGGGIVLIKGAEEQRVKGVATWAAVAECKTPWGKWPQQQLEQWSTAGVAYYANTRTHQQLPLYYQLYQDYQQNKERLNILHAVERLSIPLLICHGKNDDAVPVSSAYTLQQAAAGNLSEIFIVESDHVFGRKHPWTTGSLPEPMQKVVDKTISFFLAL